MPDIQEVTETDGR